MDVIVCVKQVLDPEIPPRDFRIDPATNQPVQGNARMVMDSYSENALEMAVQLKERTPGKRITAITVGDKPAEEALRRALSFTADAAVRVWDPRLALADGAVIGHVLALAIKALGGDALILTGRQAGDVEEGLVGPILAEELGYPCITLVSRLALEGGQVRATRETGDGHAVLQVPVRAVLTVTSSEANVPRLPKVKDAMLAKSKPIKLLGLGDIGAEPDRLQPGTRLERAFIPENDVACEILPGDEGPAQAAILASRLQELKIL